MLNPGPDDDLGPRYMLRSWSTHKTVHLLQLRCPRISYNETKVGVFQTPDLGDPATHVLRFRRIFDV
jgi:hypothetical protein